MRIKSLIIKSITVSALIISLVGCGGSSSSSSGSSSTNNGTSTGTFVDSPVYGLKYKTASQEGYTNNKGEFQYKDGEKIEFFLNSLSLGEVSATSLVTPYTMAGDTDINNPSKKASNIALLLQNFDANRNNKNMIDILKFKDLGVYDLSDIDLNSATNVVENKIAGLLATGGFQQYVDSSNLAPLNTATVNGVMKTFVEAEQNSRIISVANGFGEKWLDNRTLWTIFDNKIYEFIFKDGKQNILSDASYNQAYSIMNDGILKVDEGDNFEYYKILAIDGTKISLKEGEDLNSVLSDNTVEQYFFTTKLSAQTYLDSL